MNIRAQSLVHLLKGTGQYLDLIAGMNVHMKRCCLPLLQISNQIGGCPVQLYDRRNHLPVHKGVINRARQDQDQRDHKCDIEQQLEEYLPDSRNRHIHTGNRYDFSISIIDRGHGGSQDLAVAFMIDREAVIPFPAVGLHQVFLFSRRIRIALHGPGDLTVLLVGIPQIDQLLLGRDHHIEISDIGGRHTSGFDKIQDVLPQDIQLIDIRFQFTQSLTLFLKFFYVLRIGRSLKIPPVLIQMCDLIAPRDHLVEPVSTDVRGCKLAVGIGHIGIQRHVLAVILDSDGRANAQYQKYSRHSDPYRAFLRDRFACVSIPVHFLFLPAISNSSAFQTDLPSADIPS